MTRREMKMKAMQLIQTARPNPCLVTLAVVVFGAISSWIIQRIGGEVLYIDMDAVEALDFGNMYRLDLSGVTPVNAVFILAFRILYFFLGVGFTQYCLNISRGEKGTFSDLLTCFEFPLRALVLRIVLTVLLSALYMLLIVPGIVASMSYAMSNRLLCDHPDWSPFRCMRESRRMMGGHKWELFVLELSFLGWLLLAAIPGVSVFVNPYYTLTETCFYLRIAGETKPTADEDTPPWEY